MEEQLNEIIKNQEDIKAAINTVTYTIVFVASYTSWKIGSGLADFFKD